MTRWARRLFVVGVILLLPGACLIATGSLTADDDASVAFTPIVRLSLESLRGGHSVKLFFRVPDSSQWKRIRQNRVMGDNGHIVLATTKSNNKLIPFSPLDIELAISGRRGQMSPERANYSPYGYSSDTPDVGLQFHPSPGEEIQVRLAARRPELLPSGELIIEPYWSGSAKDFLVGASLDSDLRPLVIRITQVAFGLLAGSIGLYLLEWLRGSPLSPSRRLV